MRASFFSRQEFNVNQRQKFIEELRFQGAVAFVQRDLAALVFLVHQLSIFRVREFL